MSDEALTHVHFDDLNEAVATINAMMALLFERCSHDGAIDVHESLMATLGCSRLLFSCIPPELREEELETWLSSLRTGVSQNDAPGIVLKSIVGGRQ